MKRISIVFAILFLSFAAWAQDGAVGVILGDPSGFTGRLPMTGSNSLDVAFGSSPSGGHWHLHGTYLWDGARSFSVQGQPVEMYYGVGARIASVTSGRHEDKTGIGARFSTGVLTSISNPDLEFFAEIAPVLNITPAVDADLDFAIGARIRF